MVKVWEGIPMPSLARKELETSQAFLHVFRLSEGIDIFKNTIYFVETRDIMGGATEFTEDNSHVFEDKDAAYAFYHQAHKNAHSEYARIIKKLKEGD